MSPLVTCILDNILTLPDPPSFHGMPINLIKRVGFIESDKNTNSTYADIIIIYSHVLNKRYY